MLERLEYDIYKGHACNLLRVNKRKAIIICTISMLRDVILFVEEEYGELLYREKE